MSRREKLPLFVYGFGFSGRVVEHDLVSAHDVIK